MDRDTVLMQAGLNRLRNTLLEQFPELSKGTFALEHKVGYTDSLQTESYHIWVHYEGLRHTDSTGCLHTSASTIESAVNAALAEFPQALRPAVELQRDLEAVRQLRQQSR